MFEMINLIIETLSVAPGDIRDVADAAVRQVEKTLPRGVEMACRRLAKVLAYLRHETSTLEVPSSHLGKLGKHCTYTGRQAPQYLRKYLKGT